MKKLLLIATVCMLSLSLYAENEKPFVIIHKSNGGWWAWLNLYNEIVYTPSVDEFTPAMLDCTGAGFSACRVPKQNLFSTNNPYARIPSGIDLSPLICDAINEIIAKSEETGARGIRQGSASKQIAVRNNSRGGSLDTYVVKGVWSYNAYGEGTMKIYLDKSDLLNHRL